MKKGNPKHPFNFDQRAKFFAFTKIEFSNYFSDMSMKKHIFEGKPIKRTQKVERKSGKHNGVYFEKGGIHN